MSEHVYRLRYELEMKAGSWTRDEAAAASAEKGSGFSDAMLVTSLIYPADGSLSTFFHSLDGRTGQPLDDHEVFKFWLLLGRRLGESKTLDARRKGLAFTSFDITSSALMGGR